MNSRLILDALARNVDYKIDFVAAGEYIFLRNLSEEQRRDYSAKMTKVIVDHIISDHQNPSPSEVFDWAKKSAINLMEDYQQDPYNEKITRIRILIELHLKKYEMKTPLPSLFYSSSFQQAKALVNELKRHERVATTKELIHFFKARKYSEGLLLFSLASPIPHDVINTFKQMGEEQLNMLLARDFLGSKWRKGDIDIIIQDLMTLISSLPSDALRGMLINDVLSKLDPIQLINLLDRRRKLPYHYEAVFSGLQNPYVDRHLLCKKILQAKLLIDQKKDHAYIEDLFIPISLNWLDSLPHDNQLVDFLSDAMFEYRDQCEDDPHQQFQAQAIINEYHLEASQDLTKRFDFQSIT